MNNCHPQLIINIKLCQNLANKFILQNKKKFHLKLAYKINEEIIMVKAFGPMEQIGIVVDNFEDPIKHWT